MAKKLLLTAFLFIWVSGIGYTYNSYLPNDSRFKSLEFQIKNYYESLNGNFDKPSYPVFRNALTGFFNLKKRQLIKNNILTIVDFSLASDVERLWVIDLNRMQITHRSLVSHGRNSGELYANNFSNLPSSNKSSLGFYITGNIYKGQHGVSLSLEGIEKNINDKARDRAIVIHSADYVSRAFIRHHGRLGRSQGCPAIPVKNHKKIIKALAGGSCLYIYHPHAGYHSKTKMYDKSVALEGMNLFVKESAEDIQDNRWCNYLSRVHLLSIQQL